MDLTAPCYGQVVDHKVHDCRAGWATRHPKQGDRRPIRKGFEVQPEFWGYVRSKDRNWRSRIDFTSYGDRLPTGKRNLDIEQ